MSKEPRTGLRRDRGTVTKIRESITLPGEEQILPPEQPGSNIIAAPIRPRPAEPDDESTALSPDIHERPFLEGDIVAPKPKRGIALPKIPPVLASFIGFVLIPAFAAGIYYALIASDQLSAEARFAVRQVESDVATPLSGDGGAAGASVNFSFTATGQNAYIVTSYIHSRAIVDDISTKLDLRAIFRRPEADFWARLKRDASIDELVEYWNGMVGTYIDGPSGIVTLQVRAFRSEDAVAIAKAVLEFSEALVNRVSDRARHDAMEMSEKEVRRAYGLTQAALADMNQFRNSAGMIDPVQAGTEIGKLLLPLLTEKIKLESELFVASKELNDNAPSVRALKSRLESAEKQIADLKAKLTNAAGGQTIANSLSKFEELELQRQFAEKLYTLAQADLDRARIRANRQSIYLTVFVPPSMPQESRYPRRFAFPVLILLGLTIVWAIVMMIIASVEDHRL